MSGHFMRNRREISGLDGLPLRVLVILRNLRITTLVDARTALEQRKDALCTAGMDEGDLDALQRLLSKHQDKTS